MDLCGEVEQILKREFELVRHKKHRVFRHRETGNIISVAKTPSDRRAYQNIRREVEHARRPRQPRIVTEKVQKG